MGDDMPDQAVKKFQKKLSAIRECEKKLIAISTEAMDMARKLPKESSDGLWVYIEAGLHVDASGEWQQLMSKVDSEPLETQTGYFKALHEKILSCWDEPHRLISGSIAHLEGIVRQMNADAKGAPHSPQSGVRGHIELLLKIRDMLSTVESIKRAINGAANPEPTPKREKKVVDVEIRCCSCDQTNTVSSDKKNFVCSKCGVAQPNGPTANYVGITPGNNGMGHRLPVLGAAADEFDQFHRI